MFPLNNNGEPFPQRHLQPPLKQVPLRSERCPAFRIFQLPLFVKVSRSRQAMGITVVPVGPWENFRAFQFLTVLDRVPQIND